MYCGVAMATPYLASTFKKRGIGRWPIPRKVLSCFEWELHHATHSAHAGTRHCGGRVLLFLLGDDAFGGEEHAGD